MKRVLVLFATTFFTAWAGAGTGRIGRILRCIGLLASEWLAMPRDAHLCRSSSDGTVGFGLSLPLI